MPKRLKFDPALVATITVPHTAFVDGQERLQEVFDSVGAGHAEPMCLAIIGSAGSGKSKLLKRLLRRFPPVRKENGLVVPVLCVQVPEDPKVKGLVEACLREIGDPLWDNADAANKKTERLKALMKAAKVRVLCLDEFHHFYDKATDRVQLVVTDWLKLLTNLNEFSVVVAGMPVSTHVLRHNPQLRDRFQAPVELPRFDWKRADHQAEWMGILKAFTVGIRKQHDIIDLYEARLAFRLYLACGGRMRPLVNTLAEAVQRAAKESRREIGVGHLANAYKKVVWTQFKSDDWDVFNIEIPEPANTPELIRLALALIEEDELVAQRKRRRRGSLSPQVKEALSTQY